MTARLIDIFRACARERSPPSRRCAVIAMSDHRQREKITVSTPVPRRHGNPVADIITEFTSGLARYAQTTEGAAFVAWIDGPECARIWQRIFGPPTINPAGFGSFTEDGRQIDFFLEIDKRRRLRDLYDAIDGYAEIGARCTDEPPWVLMWFTDPGREQNARQQIITNPRIPGLRVATATAPTDASPADQIWLPISLTNDRTYRLAELADFPPLSVPVLDDDPADESASEYNPADDPRSNPAPGDDLFPPDA
jgi:hypothetical protein